MKYFYATLIFVNCLSAGFVMAGIGYSYRTARITGQWRMVWLGVVLLGALLILGDLLGSALGAVIEKGN